jgi:lysine-specific permease
VIVFIILGIFVNTAVLGGHYYGTEVFRVGGIQGLGVLSTFLTAGFSFQGTELVGVAAGESENPRKNVPKAIKQVFWRIILFYILSILIIGLIIPYDDPSLLNDDVSHISVSPFTLVFIKAGINPAARKQIRKVRWHFVYSYFSLPCVDIMNAVILTTVLSAGNSGLYASSRTLLDLANEGKAPRFFRKITKNGIPIYCVLLTAAIGMLAFLTSLFGNGVLYRWLLNISGVAGFIAWLGIVASHWRFRRAYVLQGYKIDDLPFKAKTYPVGSLFAFIVCLFVLVGQGYDSWTKNTVVASDIIAAYIGIPFVLVAYTAYKIIKKTKLIPLAEVDLISGREAFLRYMTEKTTRSNPYLTFFITRRTLKPEEENNFSEDISIFRPSTWKHIFIKLKSLRNRFQN